MAYLIVRQPGQVAFSLPARDGLQVGRHPGNDLVLADHQVSRTHASFADKSGRWRVVDRGSTHGTFVNGRRIETADLTDGDEVQVGNVLLTFVLAEDLQGVVHHEVTQIQTPPLLKDAIDKRLAVLYDASAAIRAIGDLDQVLRQMLSAVIEVLDGERGLLGLLEPGGGLRRFEAARAGARGEEVVVSRAVLHTVLERRQPVVVRDASQRSATLAGQGVVSALCVPLLAGSRVVGFVYVDDRARENRFGQEDIDYLGALAHLIAAAVEAAERLQAAEEIAEALSEGAAEEMIGLSPAMTRLKAELRKVAAAGSAHVLVHGESGTGKELAARTVHALSPRAKQPFLTVNCAAIPESMIEAELFGYEKGAFTGAVKDKRGKFVLANRGSLFLDEIGDLSPAAQAKVLRAIQEGEVQPLGSERTLQVDVRILSATHKNLVAEAAAGRFREDLYYRLNIVEISVPALRERGGDIQLLAERFLKSAGLRMGKRLDGFTAEALEVLARHRWPGNVRELQNEAERAAILSDARLVGVTDLSPRLLAQAAPALPGVAAGNTERSLSERFAELEPMERHLVEAALQKAGGNVSEAARLLGITRIMVKRRMERFNLRGGDD